MAADFDMNSLLRNAKDVHSDLRDPDKVVNRIQHFISGHGKLKDTIASPYEHGLIDKEIVFKENEDGPPDIEYFSVGMPYEGSLSPARAAAYLHRRGGPYERTGSISNYDLTSAALQLRPLKAANYSIGGSEARSSKLTVAPAMFGTGTAIETAKASDNPEEADREISDAYSKSLGSHREALAKSAAEERGPFEKVKPGQVESAIKSETSDEDMNKVARNYPELSDPRFVRVAVHPVGYKGTYRFDAIDLKSGGWAKLHPDQFFPDDQFL